MYAEKVHYTVKEILRLLDELDAFDAEKEYQNHVNRELKEDELETIDYFVTGY